MPSNKWFFGFGIFFFILGLIAPLFIPLVLMTGLRAEWKTLISGLLALGLPEVFWVIAVLLMGKPGFEFIKNKVFGWFKKPAE